jgi:hypothetical protein
LLDASSHGGDQAAVPTFSQIAIAPNQIFQKKFKKPALFIDPILFF